MFLVDLGTFENEDPERIIGSGGYARKQWPGLARPRRSKTYRGDKSSPAGRQTRTLTVFFSLSVLFLRRTVTAFPSAIFSTPCSSRRCNIPSTVLPTRTDRRAITEKLEDARIERISREINRRNSSVIRDRHPRPGCGRSLSLSRRQKIIGLFAAISTGCARISLSFRTSGLFALLASTMILSNRRFANVIYSLNVTRECTTERKYTHSSSIIFNEDHPYLVISLRHFPLLVSRVSPSHLHALKASAHRTNKISPNAECYLKKYSSRARFNRGRNVIARSIGEIYRDIWDRSQSDGGRRETCSVCASLKADGIPTPRPSAVRRHDRANCYASIA